MGLYDEVEIEDMEWSDELEAFTYSCPCGDLFQITLVWYELCVCCILRPAALPRLFCPLPASHLPVAFLMASRSPLSAQQPVSVAWCMSSISVTGVKHCCALQKDLAAGEDIARCPSCSLYVQVIYDQVKIRLSCDISGNR